jgi:hypothetical protein
MMKPEHGRVLAVLRQPVCALKGGGHMYGPLSTSEIAERLELDVKACAGLLASMAVEAWCAEPIVGTVRAGASTGTRTTAATGRRRRPTRIAEHGKTGAARGSSSD